MKGIYLIESISSLFSLFLIKSELLVCEAGRQKKTEFKLKTYNESSRTVMSVFFQKASQSKASQDEVNIAETVREITQLQAELRAMQDHDDTLDKTVEAEKHTIQEVSRILVSKTSLSFPFYYYLRKTYKEFSRPIMSIFSEGIWEQSWPRCS